MSFIDSLKTPVPATLPEGKDIVTVASSKK